VQAGKSGTLYLLDRDNLGGYASSDHVVQEQLNAVGDTGVWSSPAYWNGTVYYWGRNDTLKAFPLVNGSLSTAPTKSLEASAYPGSTPSISANGSSQGIVWTIDSENVLTGPAILEAHDAGNVATTLYTSVDNPGRDSAGLAVKFTVPTVTNGKVYVGTAGEIDVYGLLSSAKQTAAPVFTPVTGTFTGTESVTIADSTANASLYYTTNGTIATTGSTPYIGPIQVGSTETLHAIASVQGQLLSAQSFATYTATTQAAAVVFSMPAGTYASAQSVTLSDATPKAAIHFTLDGSTPTVSSTLYSAPIVFDATLTIRTIAVAAGFTASPVASATYTIQPGISFPLGFAASTGLMILNGSADLNDSRLQLTNGLTNEAGSAWFHLPVNIQTFTTTFTFQLSNPYGNGMTFAIQNNPAATKALGGDAGQLGSATISRSVAVKFDLYNSAGEGSDSTGLYLNGASPTVPAIDLSSTGINLHSDDTMSVTLIYDGTTLNMTISDLVTGAAWSTNWLVNIPATIGSYTAYMGFTGATGKQTASQKILTWTYANSVGVETVATPTISPVAGSYRNAQSVAIAESTRDATIYYTTNGTTPTSDSTRYTGPFSVTGSETVKAFAVASRLTASPSATVSYTITNPTQTASPVFAPGQGIYSSEQTLTMTDASPGSILYYTLDGSVASTSSTKYKGPIPITVALHVNAVAQAPGLTVSGTTGANFSLTVAAPVLSPPGNTYTVPQTISISDATPGALIFYTTDNSLPTSVSKLYSGPITVDASEHVNVLGVHAGYANSRVVQNNYVIMPSANALPIGNLEQAIDAMTGSATVSQKDNLFISGWAADYNDNGPAKTVQVLIDKKVAGLATLGEARPDVAAYYNNPAWEDTGYSLIEPALNLSVGQHSISSVATDSLGLTQSFGPLVIQVTP